METVIDAINQSAIALIEKDSMSDEVPNKVFNQHVMGLQSTIVYNYQLTAQVAVYEKSPERAAALWKGYLELCDKALVALNKAKSKFPGGANDLYDLILDYRDEALSRHHENAQDAEWLTSARSNPVFQKVIGSS
jgi:hypothetical protein